jgi:hypothetical protein
MTVWERDLLSTILFGGQIVEPLDTVRYELPRSTILVQHWPFLIRREVLFTLRSLGQMTGDMSTYRKAYFHMKLKRKARR